MKWFHSMEKRLMVFSIFTIIIMLIINSVVNSVSFWNKNTQSEKKMVEQHINQSLSLITDEFDKLTLISATLMASNEIYRFIENKLEIKRLRKNAQDRLKTINLIDYKNKNHLAEHLNKSLIDTLEVDAILLQTGSGKVIHSVSNFKKTTAKKIFSIISSLNMPVENGVFNLDDNIYLYSKQQVADVHTPSLINGYFTVIRVLSGYRIDEINQKLDAELSFINIANDSISTYRVDEGIFSVLENISKSNGYIDAVYHLVVDEEQVLPFNLKIKFKRELSDVEAEIQLLLCVNVVFLLLLVFTIIYLIKKNIRDPIKQFANALQILGDYSPAQPGKRADFSKSAELNLLYKKFEEVYFKLHQKHRVHEVLLEAIGDFIIRVDQYGYITYANPPLLAWFDLPLEVMRGKPLSLFLTNLQENGTSVNFWLYQALEKKQDSGCICTLRRLSKPEQLVKAEVVVKGLSCNKKANGALIVIRLPMK